MKIIEGLKNIINKLTKKQQGKQKQKEQVDFGKWLGRRRNTIVIKGYEDYCQEKKSLLSYSDGSIELSYIYEEDFPSKITYREGEMYDLKVNDIFTFKYDNGKYDASDFKIFLGTVDEEKYGMLYHIYLTQGLNEYQFKNKTIPYIDGKTFEIEFMERRKIIIFNRY